MKIVELVVGVLTLLSLVFINVCIFILLDFFDERKK